MVSTFRVGFWGSGEVTVDNATELLDTQLLPAEPDTEFEIYLPEVIKRTQRGLRSVQSALNSFELSYEQVSADYMLEQLSGKENAHLVVLGDDEESMQLAETALVAGVKVKDLCAALDDVVLAEEEPPPPPMRGKPRATETKAVEAIVEGPAIVAAGPFPFRPQPPADITAAQLLENALRSFIHEEVTNYMGLSIGHNTRLEMPINEPAHAAEPQMVRVFIDSDGKYELAPLGSKKAPRGKKSAEITLDEAAELDLI